MCEEFSLDPIRALWVLERAPLGLIADILDLRAYAQTKQALEQAKADTKAQERIYKTPHGQLVLEVEADIARTRLGRRQAGAEPGTTD